MTTNHRENQCHNLRAHLGLTGGVTTVKFKCPAHDDGTASGVASLGDDGKILITCHAGCETEDVLAAWGFSMQDLFPPDKKPISKTIVNEYPYHDSDGHHLVTKVRYSDKSFLWRYWDSRGWVYNRKGVPHVLYRLPEVLKEEGYVLVAEGEKDADTLVKAGFTATTGENGAGPGKWLPEYTAQLKGKACVVLGDNDAVGHDYQVETANALHAAGNAVKVLDIRDMWEDAPEHGDVTDLLDAGGGDVDSLRALLSTYLPLTPEWVPCDRLKPDDMTAAEEKAAAKAGTTVNVAEVKQVMDWTPPDYSDVGNSNVLLRNYGGNLLYTKSLGWLIWNGKFWERGDDKVMEYAKELSQEMLDVALAGYNAALHEEAEAKTVYEASERTEADKEPVKQAAREVKKAKDYLNHARGTRSVNRLKAMLELSKSSLIIEADKLDANPFDLNTPAGIVDLHTGEMRPHDSRAFCTQTTTASPDGPNDKKMWDDFLDTITCGSSPIKGFLQLMAGMSLIGTVYHEGIILAYGSGRNGKSTLFNALGQTFGSYHGGIDVDVLTTDKGNKGAALATLRGKRLVVCGEFEEGHRLSGSMIKKIASTDMLTVEEKFKQPETVRQSHSLVLFTNHLPRVGSTDDGTWRRLTVVPFNATIPTGGGIQNFTDVLIEKSGGAILSWAIQGAVNFTRNNFKLDKPEEIEEITDKYKAREDWLSNFVAERCAVSPDDRVGASDIYKEYRSWAMDSGDYVRRQSDFNVAMEAAGFQKIAPKGRKIWVGLRVGENMGSENPYIAVV